MTFLNARSRVVQRLRLGVLSLVWVRLGRVVSIVKSKDGPPLCQGKRATAELILGSHEVARFTPTQERVSDHRRGTTLLTHLFERNGMQLTRHSHLTKQ